MTREEFRKKLVYCEEQAESTGDYETYGSDAHYLICDFLEQLGYKEEADIFRDIGRRI